MKTTNQKLKRLTLIAVLGAVAFLLMFLAFPIIPYVPFLKLDFADVPILIGLFMLGPSGAIEILGLKLFLYWMISGFSPLSLIGIITSLVASLIIIIVFWKLHSWVFNKWPFNVGVVTVATVCLTIGMVALNWILATPLYLKLTGLKLDFPLVKLILIGVIPFNLIKGIVIGTIAVIIAKQMKRWFLK